MITKMTADNRPIVYTSTYYTEGGIRTTQIVHPPPQAEQPRPVKLASSITGLTTEADFLEEAERAGVSTPVLLDKIKGWFSRADVGAGMRNMQCGMLIKNAVKKQGA